MAMWPPWPWGKGIDAYEKVLRQRYAKATSAQVDDAVKCVTNALDTGNDERAADRAAELVRNYLDLQVGKSGGLLTFNGLAVAAATILWTNTTLSIVVWLPGLLFGALFVSSILSLIAVLIWWERTSVYSSAVNELKHLIRFTALRAWSINIAVLLSLLSVILIAIWLSLAKRSIG
jgi:hypothetical protein